MLCEWVTPIHFALGIFDMAEANSRESGFEYAAGTWNKWESDQLLMGADSDNPDSIALMFDGDDAGVDMTTRIGKKLSRIFPEERIKKCFLSRGKDPKNLCRDDFKRLLKR